MREPSKSNLSLILQVTSVPRLCQFNDSHVCPLSSIPLPKPTSPPGLLQYILTGLLASYLLQSCFILPPPRMKPLKGNRYMLLKTLPRLPIGRSWNISATYPVIQLLNAMTVVSCPTQCFLPPAIAHPVQLFLPRLSPFLFPFQLLGPGKLTLYDPVLTCLPLETFPDNFTRRLVTPFIPIPSLY